MSARWRYLRSGYGSRNADFDIVNASGGRVASTPYEDKARLITESPSMAERLRFLVGDLKALGFGSDESVPGADLVDTMQTHYREALAILARIDGAA